MSARRWETTVPNSTVGQSECCKNHGQDTNIYNQLPIGVNQVKDGHYNQLALKTQM